MTQSKWLLGSVARLSRQLVLLAALLLLAIPVIAKVSSWPTRLRNIFGTWIRTARPARSRVLSSWRWAC